MESTIVEGPGTVVPDLVDIGDGDLPRMRWVCCIIRPERLDAVKDALEQLHVVGGMTVSDVRGFGRQKGQVEHYRGGEYVVRFVPKIRLDLALRLEDVDRVLQALASAARTGQVGDGKVFVIPLRQALRIRTGERGSVAL